MSVEFADSNRGTGALSLDELRRRLDDLAMRRRLAVLFDLLLLGTALAVFAVFIYYRLDRWLTLHVAARAFLDVVLAGLLLVLAWRRLVPALLRRDDAVGTALGIERRRGLDVDLTAALQFDRALEAGRDEVYGSPRLAAAVVDRGARLCMEIDPADEPIPRQATWRRVVCALIPGAAIVWALIWPNHFLALADRMLLGDVPYPSNTRVVSATINGRTLEFPERKPGTAKPAPQRIVVPLNSTVELKIETEGEVVAAASVVVEAEHARLATVELKADPASKTKFVGSLTALAGNATCRLRAGDGEAEFVLDARPLPIISTTPVPELPDYARNAQIPPPARGALSAAVLAGSDVTIEVECVNKPLNAVALRLTERPNRSSGAKQVAAAGKSYDVMLRATDAERRLWSADPTISAIDIATGDSEKSPLSQIAAAFDYEITATDDDGFTPVEPIRGSLLIRDDGSPNVAAEMVTKFVLPTGKPKIVYRAADDIGIQSLTIARHVARSDGTTSDSPLPIPLPDDSSRTAVTGQFSLELADLQLHKGDRVTVTVEARDRTGGDQVAVSRSESFTLNVTDEPGLYEAMAETDQRSALKMDEIIQKQLLMTGRGSLSPNNGVPPPNLPLLPPSTPTPTSTVVPSATNLPSPISTGITP